MSRKDRAMRFSDIEPVGVQDILCAYLNIHDGLSDMIEGGRLREEHIPDDYRWLVGELAYVASVLDRTGLASGT